jgi:hypothetical protein
MTGRQNQENAETTGIFLGFGDDETHAKPAARP